MEGYCKMCPECNGRACKNQIPGPGAKGVGDTAIRNYDKWKEIRINMDTLTEKRGVDISLRLFGKTFSAPIFAGPVGAVNMHYGDRYNDLEYNNILVPACKDKGIACLLYTSRYGRRLRRQSLQIRPISEGRLPRLDAFHRFSPQ